MGDVISTTVSLGDIRWQVILGGFGLFLFGIKFMGDGLKSLSGDKLRDYIDKYTNKPWKGIIVGAFITGVLQSSSATTAITIGFVRSGLMSLEQAIGIILGANIGTTMTAFLVGLNVEKYALYFVFAGAMCLMFAKRKKYSYVGEILMGFGVLFYGLSMMGDELKLLKDLPQFSQLALAMGSHPLLALLGGIVMTGVIQSSSAVIAIVQKIYETGGMTLSAALPFVFGSNIGTTITGILAAIGGSLAARRTAGVHTLFNVLATFIAMLLLVPFTHFFYLLGAQYHVSSMMQIAIAHIVFNTIATIAFYPFIKHLVKLIKVVVPGDEQERIEVNTDVLDMKLVSVLPSGALTNARKITMKMGELTDDAMKNSRKFLNEGLSSYRETVLQLEDVINSLDKKLTAYLLAIVKENLGEKDVEEYSSNLQIIKNLERISDLNVNLTEFFDMVFDNRESFSTEALGELNAMYELIEHMLNRSMRIFNESDYSLGASVTEDENNLDLLEHNARQSHFDRMANATCIAVVGSSVYIDILGTLERMGDHVNNIAKNAINEPEVPVEVDD